MQALPAPSPKRVSLRDKPKRLAATIEDTCDMIGLGKTKIYELIAEGKLRTTTVGRRRLVLYESIESLLAD